MTANEQRTDARALQDFRKLFLSRWGGVAREAIPDDVKALLTKPK